MSKKELDDFKLPVAHSMLLWRVITMYKDTTIPLPLPDINPCRKSPRLAQRKENRESTNATPIRSASHGLKRLPFEVLEQNSPDSSVSKKGKFENKCTFSNKFPRVGDNAYVRIPIRKSLSSRPDLIMAMSSGVLLAKQRREAVDLLLTAMYKHIQTWYPHKEAKLQLAKDIIETFPKLKAVAGDAWGAFFDRSGGHIQQALNSKRTAMNVRKRQTSSSKKTTTSQDTEMPDKLTDNKASTSSSSESSKVTGTKASTSSSSQSSSSANTEEPPQLQMPQLSREIEIKIVNLSLIPDTKENRGVIFEEMEALHHVRQNMLAHGKTPEDILKTFPRMMSYEGALIDLDFDILKENMNNNILGTFKVVYQNAILRYVTKFAPKVSEALSSYEDDELKSLLALVAILPKYPCQSYSFPKEGKKTATNGKRGGKEVLPPNVKVTARNNVPHPALLQVIPSNEDVSTHQSKFFRTKPDGTKIVQPYLVFSSDDNEQGEFYMKANYQTFHVGPSALRAVSVLFKYHTVFDLEYDIDLLHFYDFFEFLVGMKTKLSAQTNNFLSTLQSLS